MKGRALGIVCAVLMALELGGFQGFAANPESIVSIIQEKGVMEIKPGVCYIVKGYSDGDVAQLMVVCSDKLSDSYDFSNLPEYALNEMAYKVVGEMQYGLDPELIEKVLDYLDADGKIQLNIQLANIKGFKSGELQMEKSDANKFAFRILPDMDIEKAEYYKGD